MGIKRDLINYSHPSKPLPKPELQPPSKPRKKRPDTGKRIVDLLNELERKLAKDEGPAAAKAWKYSIEGFCLDEERRRVTCVKIGGGQQLGHWLIDYLNGKL